MRIVAMTPSHFPMTNSAREIGRARIASAVPDSRSPESDGAPANTQSDDMRDEVWDAVRVDAAHDEPIAVLVDRAERRELVLRAARKTRDAYAHSVAAQQLVERPLGDDLPAIDDRDAIADLLDLGEQVRIEEHGDAAVTQATDDLADVVAPDRIEGARRLVEEHELGVAKQRDAETEPLLHALRDRADAR